MHCHRADRQPVTFIFLFWADVSRSHFLAKILVQQELLHCLIATITQAQSIAHQTLLNGGAGVTWDFLSVNGCICLYRSKSLAEYLLYISVACWGSRHSLVQHVWEDYKSQLSPSALHFTAVLCCARNRIFKCNLILAGGENLQKTSITSLPISRQNSLNILYQISD